MFVIAKILPLLMAGESALAALIYALQGDWRHAFYWASAASITYSATLL